MTDLRRDAGSMLAWGLAEAPIAGEERSGDRALVAALDSGILLAGVDGLGHGPAAADAAVRAIATLERWSDIGLLPLVRRCHEALIGTRGVVMTVARIAPDEGTLAWIGVGNVAGVLLRADRAARPPQEAVLQRGGVVGYNLPALSATVTSISPGDLLVLATDGVGGDFIKAVVPEDGPQAIADRILRQYRLETDDALVLVAQYLGPA